MEQAWLLNEYLVTIDFMELTEISGIEMTLIEQIEAGLRGVKKIQT